MSLNEKKSIHRKIGRLEILSTATSVLLLTGCSSNPSNDAAPVTSSPFFTGAATNGGIQVDTLRAFGDSYTDFGYTDPRAHKNWSRELVISGIAKNLENYAIGGATARTNSGNTFDNQITRWDANNSLINKQDLTVAYFGYNDIGRAGGSLGQSKANYTNSVNSLIARGAANGNNRIFVTQIHDWSATPGISDTLRGRVVEWNNHVASIANSNPNVIAVDLFTVFERARNDPAAFGLANATDVDKERSYTDYLYFDSLHFGSKGQEIIARVYTHYLTRGWNWASALDAGGAATTQLNRDLDNSLLAFGPDELRFADSSFRMLPLTTRQLFATTQDPSRKFNTNNRSNFSNDWQLPLGLAFEGGSRPLNGVQQSRLGVALTHHTQTQNLAGLDGRSSTRFNSRAGTLYWMKPHAGFLFSTQLTRAAHKFDQTAKDDLINRVVSNARVGHTWSLEGKARYSHKWGEATWTPWVSLAQQSHTLNAGTSKSLYTTDISYAATKAVELNSTVGLDVQSGILQLKNGQRLVVAGSLHHTESLSRSALRIQMREQINPSAIMTEVISRPEIRKTQLGLNAQFQFSKELNLRADYSVDLQKPKSSQAISLMTAINF